MSDGQAAKVERGSSMQTAFLIGTRWFGVLGPCRHIIRSLVDSGYRVVVFGQEDKHYKRYYDDNCDLVKIKMRRTYFSPFSDFVDIIKIVCYLAYYRPEVVHTFNPKPAILGWASIVWFRKIRFLVGITGMGNTFIRQPRLKKYIIFVLRRVANRAKYMFFQNLDDVEFFGEEIIRDKSKIRMFISPGVDLLDFPMKNRVVDHSSGTIRVVCMARLIWQKGIREFVDTARIVKSKMEGVEFILVGEIDTEHPDAVDAKSLEDFVGEGIIQHIDWTDDVASLLSDCNIFFLHSYREGAPRAILEASAVGLPTVGSDAIGVRELVVDGVTGTLVPLNDVEACVHAILDLVNNAQKRVDFGENARKLIAEKFSLENASKAQLEMYKGLPNIL